MDIISDPDGKLRAFLQDSRFFLIRTFSVTAKKYASFSWESGRQSAAVHHLFDMWPHND